MKTVIGNHAITLGSVENNQVETLFSGGEKADIIYSDPPWGDGNMKYWATQCEKMTGTRPKQFTYAEMLARFNQLIKNHCKGAVFIETGPRWEQQVIEAMQSIGVQISQVVRIVYGSGKTTFPNILICGSVNGVAPIVPPGTENLKGVKLPTSLAIANAVPGGILFDPCCGMGYSAKAAVAAKMRFRGNEFNAKRLALTEKFLRSRA